MCQTASVSAWETNAAISVTMDAITEPVSYRTLLAAVCLAEATNQWDTDIALRAVENNGLREGLDLGVHAFGIEFEGHRGHLDPAELDQAVRLARHFAGLLERPA